MSPSIALVAKLELKYSSDLNTRGDCTHIIKLNSNSLVPKLGIGMRPSIFNLVRQSLTLVCGRRVRTNVTLQSGSLPGFLQWQEVTCNDNSKLTLYNNGAEAAAKLGYELKEHP